MSGPRLILRANASEHIGAGHVMRLVALAQAAHREGCESHFLLGGDPDFAAAKVREAGFECTISQAAVGSEGDVEECAELARSVGCVAVVVDGYDFDKSYLAALSDLHTTVAIDDLADRPLPVHMVVNPNYGAEELHYEIQAKTRVLAGCRYAMLRSEFTQRPRPSESAMVQRSPRIVLTFGATDPFNASTLLVKALATLRVTLPIRLVRGAGFAARQELESAISQSGLNLEVVDDPQDMAEALAWGTLAITAAGGTLWELSYLGLAVTGFSVVANQMGTARSLAERRMIFGGQRLQDLRPNELCFVLEEFLRDADRRDEYAGRYRRLIDGRGAGRVYAGIIEMRDT